MQDVQEQNLNKEENYTGTTCSIWTIAEQIFTHLLLCSVVAALCGSHDSRRNLVNSSSPLFHCNLELITSPCNILPEFSFHVDVVFNRHTPPQFKCSSAFGKWLHRQVEKTLFFWLKNENFGNSACIMYLLLGGSEVSVWIRCVSVCVLPIKHAHVVDAWGWKVNPGTQNELSSLNYQSHSEINHWVEWVQINHTDGYWYLPALRSDRGTKSRF